jgi:hypothetical protein
MYLSMVRKGIPSGALLLCLLISARLPALERTMELGKDSLWSQMKEFQGVSQAPGRWGFRDLVLSTAEYAPDGATELLLHFNTPGEGDAAGGYHILRGAPAVSFSVTAQGAGAAVFEAGKPLLALGGPQNGMFAPGSVWRDFSVEFWLSPSTLADGETILSWDMPHREGQGLTAQSMRCQLLDRRLVWSFQALFTRPDRTRMPVNLTGTRQLLPRVWHHHLLRFDSRIGLLEYLIDGIPDGAVHVTDTGREGGDVALPEIGRGRGGELLIAPRYTGFLDELRVSRQLVDSPAVQRYSGTTGTAVSSILDLGFTRTRVRRIESVFDSPADSAVAFYYKISDTWTNPRSLGGAPWVPFVPAVDFKDTARGRYLQVMVELFPDGRRSRTPRVSSLSIVYEPNLPPAPPAGFAATPGNGKVTLQWRPVNDLTVKGYRVFYGDAPHTYLGTDAAQGESPLDAGSTTRLEVTGLENGKLYYFAVATYDDSDPPQLSAFSAEVSGRPSRIYQ